MFVQHYCMGWEEWLKKLPLLLMSSGTRVTPLVPWSQWSGVQNEQSGVGCLQAGERLGWEQFIQPGYELVCSLHV